MTVIVSYKQLFTSLFEYNLTNMLDVRISHLGGFTFHPTLTTLTALWHNILVAWTIKQTVFSLCNFFDCRLRVFFVISGNRAIMFSMHSKKMSKRKRGWNEWVFKIVRAQKSLLGLLPFRHSSRFYNITNLAAIGSYNLL